MSDELPEGWASRPLGNLIAPSKKKAEADDAKGLRYVGLEHIESNTNRLIGHGASEDVRSTMAVFQAGDVLFSKLRPYLNKVTVAPFDGVGSTEILVFDRREHIHSKFLMWLLSRQETVRIANDRAAGVQLPRVTFDKIADVEVPVAPLPEQRRIVAKVEALLEQVNRAKGRLDRVPKILKRFRQAVLAAACSGELTREWREEHPNLHPRSVAKLAEARHRLWQSRQQAKARSRSYPEPFQAVSPNELPEEWQWVSVSQVALLDVGFAFKSTDFSDKGIRLLRGENVEPGSLRWKDTRFLPTEKIDPERHVHLEEGDIILGMDRPLVSAGLKLARVRREDLPALLVQRVLRFKTIEHSDAGFLYLCLSDRRFVDFLAHDGMTGSDLPHITGTGVAEFPVPLPPMEEQAEIVRQVDRLFALADTIEARVKAATARADKLPQAILSKAFSGELVLTEAEIARVEGRAYETAEQLLQRVQGAKAKAPAKKPKRGTR